MDDKCPFVDLSKEIRARLMEQGGVCTLSRLQELVGYEAMKEDDYSGRFWKVVRHMLTYCNLHFPERSDSGLMIKSGPPPYQVSGSWYHSAEEGSRKGFRIPALTPREQAGLINLVTAGMAIPDLVEEVIAEWPELCLLPHNTITAEIIAPVLLENVNLQAYAL